jgi:hypothetical protein
MFGTHSKKNLVEITKSQPKTQFRENFQFLVLKSINKYW